MITSTINDGAEQAQTQQTGVSEEFLFQLKLAYGVETQHLKILNEMLTVSSGKVFSETIEYHLDITEVQLSRIEESFAILGITPAAAYEETFQQICGETSSAISAASDSGLSDAALLSAAERIESYEIKLYTRLVALSSQTENKDIQEFFRATLDEEEYAFSEMMKINSGLTAVA
jgi:ferritin-like metal-binding protein YciE